MNSAGLESLAKEVSPRKDPNLVSLITIIKPRKMVEIGSWYGASALTFLHTSRLHGTKLSLLCIDTWLGSREHWKNLVPHGEWSRDRLILENGEPGFFHVFCNVMKLNNFKSQVQVLRCPSEYSDDFLRANWSDSQLVYIDGDHSTRAVKADLSVSYTSCPNAVISGDDFGFLTVTNAVYSFCVFRKLKLLVSESGATFALVSDKQKQFLEEFKNHDWQEKNKLYGFCTSTIRRLVSGMLVKFNSINTTKSINFTVNEKRESL